MVKSEESTSSSSTSSGEVSLKVDKDTSAPVLSNGGSNSSGELGFLLVGVDKLMSIVDWL